MLFSVSEVMECVYHYQKILNKVKSQLADNTAYKGEDKYMHGKLKTLK